MKGALLLFATAATALVCPKTGGRTDCGYVGITADMCKARGCCWEPADNQAYCFYPELPNEFPTSPYTRQEEDKIMSYLLKNVDISGTGMVIASPSREDPDYYFDWMRDSALTMYTVFDYQSRTSSLNYSLIRNWAAWLRRAAEMPSPGPNGIHPIEEPKFEVPSGAVYTGGWCRPQNDGPSLKAIALLRLLDAMGEAVDAYGLNILSHFLDFITDHWADSTCDLWEEVRSTSFFWNGVVHLRALSKGAAAVEKSMGKSRRTEMWRNAASRVRDSLLNHIPTAYGGRCTSHPFIIESDNRPLDSAVLLAVMQLDDLRKDNVAVEPLLDIMAPVVDATIGALVAAFRAVYPINGADDARGLPGVLIGRYPDDVYYGGNPWILLTQALAELHFRRAAAAAAKGDKLRAMAEMLQGDGALQRVRFHVKDIDLHMAEQLDKHTGYELSAKDLTWSYNTFVNAMRERKAAEAAVLALGPLRGYNATA